MAKIIGMTPRTLTEDGVLKQFVNQTYVDAIVGCGYNVLMLTLDNPNPEEIFELCDGFLITGGSDLDPVYFGENNDEGLSKGINPSLDILDKKVVEYAAKTKKPLLGICRGHQSINAFLGGTLHQHIGDSHKNLQDGHKVKTIKNRLLNFDEEIITNSYHHQAVKDVAPNMTAVCWHEDGTIEAIIHNELPIIGIQWHPEKFVGNKVSNVIFGKFKELVDNNK